MKFRTASDDLHAGVLEHIYFKMAHDAKIQVPETRILARSKENPGYFAIRRFDRIGNRRVHLHTLSGLLHVPPSYPALDYKDLLLVTRKLTQDENCVEEMFRRACFNVLAHNRDDHSRNFSFLMDEQGVWRPSPAYDLTFSPGPGGEHMMMVAGEGRNPSISHLTALAENVGLRGASAVIDEVRSAVLNFSKYADEYKVPAQLKSSVLQQLNALAARS